MAARDYADKIVGLVAMGGWGATAAKSALQGLPSSNRYWRGNVWRSLPALKTRDQRSAALNDFGISWQALKEHTRTRVPLDWAGTTFNTGPVHEALFVKSGDMAQLQTALGLIDAALEVFSEAQAGHYIGLAEQARARVFGKLNV